MTSIPIKKGSNSELEREKVAMLRDRLTQMISLTSKQISGLKSQCLQLYSIGTKSQPEAPPENVLAMSE
ncbi:hypothetical protein MAR_001826 [Mya arenaria]|uniref:Uncharacterized protein n=1 Tax=Mya arenaria TaxID=6604 RepID=A0ABY7FGZ7_MYAAR|nr:hypothetical protein MAR_001826 [Mya arenaria]